VLEGSLETPEKIPDAPENAAEKVVIKH
jgi:hypothetical protein